MNSQRRAHFLLVAISIMTIVGSILFVGERGYHALAGRTQQSALDAAVAQRIADARLWIDHHPERVANMHPGDAIELNTDDADTQSTRAQVTIARAADTNTLSIAVRITSGRFASRMQIEIQPREASAWTP